MKKLLNGSPVDMTPQEVADFNARQAAFDAGATQRLLNALAAHRYKIETGGTIVNGMAVATDDRAKLMLNGARNAALADEEFVTKWKTPQGFITLSAAQIIALSDAVAAHVNKCFMAEATVAANVASYDTDAEIIAAFNQEMA